MNSKAIQFNQINYDKIGWNDLVLIFINRFAIYYKA